MIDYHFINNYALPMVFLDRGTHIQRFTHQNIIYV